MVETLIEAFEADVYLATAGAGLKIVQRSPTEVFFSQGDVAHPLLRWLIK